MMTLMPTPDRSVRRPILPTARRPVARADLLATNVPAQQPRATLPNRVFRGG